VLFVSFVVIPSAFVSAPHVTVSRQYGRKAIRFTPSAISGGGETTKDTKSTKEVKGSGRRPE
jgi:V8-like Glu-specific endopeptidase